MKNQFKIKNNLIAIIFLLCSIADSHAAGNGGNSVESAVGSWRKTPVTQLVSINREGTDSGNNNSSGAVISADGRFVAFLSFASDLVKTDSNGNSDVFIRDRKTGKTSLVSINRWGTDSGNSYSYFPVISADGRFVAFVSKSSDLVNSKVDGKDNIFLRDMKDGTTKLVSVNKAGKSSGIDFSYYQSILLSANGRFVIFNSYASDLVKNDINGKDDIFIRDLKTGTTSLISVNRTGTASGNRESSFPELSSDGHYVAFTSQASDLVENDANGMGDAFLHDLITRKTILVSVNNAGTGSGNGFSSSQGVSANGRFVAFSSEAGDLVANDTNTLSDAFVRDLKTGKTIVASVNLVGTTTSSDPDHPNEFSHAQKLSDDGRFLLFTSSADNLVEYDENREGDVFVRDLKAAKTLLVSVNIFGNSGGNFSSDAVMSANGRFVAFYSEATALVDNNTIDGSGDIFVRDLKLKKTMLVSADMNGQAIPGASSPFTYQLNANGKYIVFSDYAGNIVSKDSNGFEDVFIRRNY